LLDIDQLALVEYHAVGIVAAAVGVTVASVAERLHLTLLRLHLQWLPQESFL
jgi:hypothetical protein